MPKRLYEPPVIFDKLLVETEEQLKSLPEPESFKIHTVDFAYRGFADELIDEHYPPQHQLPLDD